MDADFILDQALDSLAPCGQVLRNGLSSHAPMVAEALCALDRADAVGPWIDRTRSELQPWPEPVEPIAPDHWRETLGRRERVSDWRVLVADDLAGCSRSEGIERWVRRLAPGFCSDATHGAIRVAHAVRALDRRDTPARRRELADGIAVWAATYQELRTDPAASMEGLSPWEAIQRVALQPEADRRFKGTIVGSLGWLNQFEAFGGVHALISLEDDSGTVLSELTETFARVFLANAEDPLSSIVFAHGVTSLTALRSLQPHLTDETTRSALRFAWQAACALYVSFGKRPPIEQPASAAPTSRDDRIAAAIATGDDHAVKLLEACLRENAIRESDAYLRAADRAIALLRPPS